MKNTRRTRSSFEGGKPEPPSYKDTGIEVSKDAQAQEMKELSKIKPDYTQGEWKKRIEAKILVEPKERDYRRDIIVDRIGVVAISCGNSLAEAEANAQRVVKAVNIHDELLSALVDARNLIQVINNTIVENGTCTISKEQSTIVTEIDSLLKQAGEK